MRRVAVACAVFAAGVLVGTAILRPAHRGSSARERHAEAAVEAVSGATALRVACAADHCGVVVRRAGATTCEGWLVPVRGDGALGRPRRAALAAC